MTGAAIPPAGSQPVSGQPSYGPRDQGSAAQPPSGQPARGQTQPAAHHAPAQPGPGQVGAPPSAPYAPPGTGRPPVPPMGVPAAAGRPVPGKPPALPVVPTGYTSFFRSPRWRWWRGLLALLMAGGLGLVVIMVVSLVALLLELALGLRTIDSLVQMTLTPVLFAANNVALALLIPVSMLTAWATTGQRPGWLSSVAGRLRWRLLLLSLAVCAVPYAVMLAFELPATLGGMRWLPTSLFMILTIALTTPLQAAGEEYALRGLCNRAVAAWIPHELGGAVLGGILSSLVFMALHGAGDVYLNIFYLLFGAIACRLTYRTGGLEAAVAFHVVNNLTSMVSLPFTDISGLFDRSAGTVSGFGEVAFQLGVMIVSWGALEGLAHYLKVERRTAPGAALAPVGSAPAGSVPPAPPATGVAPTGTVVGAPAGGMAWSDPAPQEAQGRPGPAGPAPWPPPDGSGH